MPSPWEPEGRQGCVHVSAGLIDQAGPPHPRPPYRQRADRCTWLDSTTPGVLAGAIRSHLRRAVTRRNFRTRHQAQLSPTPVEDSSPPQNAPAYSSDVHVSSVSTDTYNAVPRSHGPRRRDADLAPCGVHAGPEAASWPRTTVKTPARTERYTAPPPALHRAGGRTAVLFRLSPALSRKRALFTAFVSIGAPWPEYMVRRRPPQRPANAQLGYPVRYAVRSQSGSATVRSTSTSCPAKPSWATPKSVLAVVNAGPRADSVSRRHAAPRMSLSLLRT